MAARYPEKLNTTMKLTPASLLFMIFLVIHLELIQAAASTPLSRRNVMDSDENETVPLTLLRSQPPTKQLITENPDSELSTLDIWWNISDHNSKQMRRLGSRSDRQRENKSSGKKSTDTSKKSLDILSKETGRQISNGLLDIRPRSASSTKSHTEARKTRLNSRRRSQSKSRRHHSSNGLEGVNEEADDKVKQESNAKLDYEIFFENSIMSMSMHVTESPGRSPTLTTPSAGLETVSPVTSLPSVAPASNPTKTTVTSTPSLAPSSHPTQRPTASPVARTLTKAPATSSPSLAPSSSPMTLNPIQLPTAGPVARTRVPKTNSPVVYPPTNDPSVAPARDYPTSFPSGEPSNTMVCDPLVTLAQRQVQLLSILNRVTPKALILTPGTSQNQAFVWLVKDDLAMVCPQNILDVIQRYVLAVSYFSLGGNHWDKCNAASSMTVAPCVRGERYLSGANVCNWFSVTCVTNGVNVVGVDLENNNLVGSLPNEFSALTQLKSIDFNTNGKISGSIPTSYGSIATLMDLNLYMNNIMGVLPEALCSATMLKRINVESNSLVGTIATCLGMLDSLTMLALDSNRFSGTLPSEIGRMPALEFLTLDRNAFTGKIPRELGNNSNLKVLSIQQNGFTGRIPTQLGALNGLDTLNFFSNMLTGPIPSELGNLLNLENLFLHFNEVSGTMPESICALRADRGLGKIIQLTADCGPRGKIDCPRSCCTACF